MIEVIIVNQNQLLRVNVSTTALGFGSSTIGNLDQVRDDLLVLETLGCDYVLLDTHHDDIEASRNLEEQWRMLAVIALLVGVCLLFSPGNPEQDAKASEQKQTHSSKSRLLECNTSTSQEVI